MTAWRKVLLIFILLGLSPGCRGNDASPVAPRAAPSLDLVKTVTLTTDAEGGSARPEIVATADRVFVAYLGHIGNRDGRSFDVKVYDRDLVTQLSSTTIVPPSADYGAATDIRVAGDGQKVFTFYETVTTTTSYLHGATYALNDTFDRVAGTSTPIASGKPVFQLTEGDEILNDPAPLVGPDSVFVVTRLWSSISTTGNTVYRVREFSKSDLSLLSPPFDLDLSGVADGRAQVTSLLFSDVGIFMTLATTVSNTGLNDTNRMSDDGALCDIILVKMRPDWTFDPLRDVRTISAEPDDRENYITGLRTDGTYFYVTYKQAVASPPAGQQKAIIKIFDRNFFLLHKEEVKSVSWGGPNAGEIRPSLEVMGKRIYSGQSDSYGLGTGNAEISVFEVN